MIIRLLLLVTVFFATGWTDESCRNEKRLFYTETTDNYEPTFAQQLHSHLMRKRGPEVVKPKRNSSQPVDVNFKMELYQIIELNERQQYVTVSVWVVERWYDEFLYWNPKDFGNITETKVHHSMLWLPDTTLYNTLVMKDDDQRRPQHVKLTTDVSKNSSLVEFLYPAIYKFYCRLYLQFFPFDSQKCQLVFGSWTSDNTDIDYFSVKEGVRTSNYKTNEGWTLQSTQEVVNQAIGTNSYVQNDEWNLLGITAHRNLVKYDCCAHQYTLLEFTLYLRRRPLFYLLNLVIPTFIITLIAITGFFTTSSTTGIREEKISLCITTLLSMSILLMMISDQLPSTSAFIPLISWFYLSAILIISLGAICASFVISIQKFGSQGERLPPRGVAITRVFSSIGLVQIPDHLQPKDKLLEFAKLYGIAPETFKCRDSVDVTNSRKSTITQFAKFVFTVGNEGYPSNLSFRRKDGRQPAHVLLNESPDAKRAGSCENYEFQPRRQSTIDEEKPKQMNTRKLAVIEFEWLATVIERWTFLFFLFTFLLVSLGINFIGVVHWLNSCPPSDAVPVAALQ